MKRQREFGTFSASSICIFCAHRLGSIDLPAATSFSRPYLHLPRSLSHRRDVSTTPAASASCAENNNTHVAQEINPNSLQSMPEQRERAGISATSRQNTTRQSNRSTLRLRNFSFRNVKTEPTSRHNLQRDEVIAERGLQSGWRHLVRTGSLLGPRDSEVTPQLVMKKQPNPFGAPASTNGTKWETSAQSPSGWGTGSSRIAPLQYSKKSQLHVRDSVLNSTARHGETQPNNSISDSGGFRSSAQDWSKSFGPAQGAESHDLKRNSRNQNEEIIQDQATHSFKTYAAHASGSQIKQSLRSEAEQHQYFSNSSGAQEAVNHVTSPERSGLTNSGLSTSQKPGDVDIFDRPSFSSTGTRARKTYKILSEHAAVKSEKLESERVASSTPSFEVQGLDFEMKANTIDSSESAKESASEQRPDKHQRKPSLFVQSAWRSSHFGMADQTQPGPGLSESVLAKTIATGRQLDPPVSPSAATPASVAATPANETSWSPESAAQFQVSGPVRATQGTLQTSWKVGTRFKPPVHDSGYRAVPFRAEEYRSPSTFNEKQAANWRHLRRTTNENSGNSSQSSQPALQQRQELPNTTAQQQVQQRQAFAFEDETWVERTFGNHLREREEVRRLQQEREARRANIHWNQETHGYPRATSAPADAEVVTPRQLYDGPAQAYRDKQCGRCGEMGHIARHCTKETIVHFHRKDFRTTDRAPLDPFLSRETSKDRVQNPLETREVRDTEHIVPTGSAHQPDPGRKTAAFKRYVPNQISSPNSVRSDRGVFRLFEATDGRAVEQSERAAPGRAAEGDGDSTFARRATKFALDEDAGEFPPPPDSRISRERAKWVSRRAGAEEHIGRDRGKAAIRRGQHSGRRDNDEDEDEEAEAREIFRARKAARLADKQAKEDKRRQGARHKRELRKAEDATPISIPEFVSVQQLSQLLGVRHERFVDRLEELGYDDVFPGMTLNAETSAMIAMEYNFDPTIDTGAKDEERDLQAQPDVEDAELLPVRPPVVTIMGHVDHGKTTILDYLRQSSVAAGEAGGITQHIGAFSVPMASSGRTITFLDTPGHAAFLAMRQRGAIVTDMVILVVAADDSVKPQTLEAIKHAKAAGVPMIVAINKVDKPEADIQRVKQDLARHNVDIEDFGGETQVVSVSGKTGQGMEDLEETVVALSEILDHRADADGAVEGWILEATMKERGRVATVLVRRGTLKPGTVIVAGQSWARVRTLRNEVGTVLQEVGPGMPVEVDGWREQPVAGDEVLEAPSEQRATSVVEYRRQQEERVKVAADMDAINAHRRSTMNRQQKERETAQAVQRAQLNAHAHGGTADIANQLDVPNAPRQDQSGQIEVPFIIKADVSGSAEAVSAYILSLSNPLVAPVILQSKVGAVYESDVALAKAVGGHIIAFNVPTDPQMRGLAEAQGVQIFDNNIIYRVIDDVRAVLEEKLPPVINQRVLGEAEISASFEISGGGKKKIRVAGCKVRNGIIGKASRVRVWREGKKVYDGVVTSLKNVKKDVKEMRKGSECGMGFEDWEGFEVGDQVQTYEETREKRRL